MGRPSTIPIFPLPNVVHFPDVPLPLHIFEPRYREMTRDALSGDRVIGMVLLRRGWEASYQEEPPVFEVGTAGEIARSDELPDGRYNIVLRGLQEFSILNEEPGRPYRRATVTWRDRDAEPPPLAVVTRMWTLVREYLEACGRKSGMGEEPATTSDPAQLVNFFCQQLDLDPIERQGLLEAPNMAERARGLISAVELQLEAVRSGGGSGPATLQ